VPASGLPLLKKNSFTWHLLTIARALEIRGWKSDIAGRDPEVSGKRRVEKQIEQLQFVIQSRSRQPQQLTLTIQRDLLFPKLNRLPLLFNTQVQIFFQPVKFNLELAYLPVQLRLKPLSILLSLFMLVSKESAFPLVWYSV